jgi:hypothetical protein
MNAQTMMFLFEIPVLLFVYIDWDFGLYHCSCG